MRPIHTEPDQGRTPSQRAQVQRALLAAACILPACGLPAIAVADPPIEGAVATSRNDNYRTGANTREKKLRPQKINVDRFGLQFTRQVDGKIYAQPLFVPRVKTADRSRHDIVYAVTAHNTVYAFDAKHASREAPLWSRNLGPPVPNSDLAGFNADGTPRSCSNIFPEVGITGTPTIDLASNTMYLVAKIKENGQWFNRLFALDIGTGESRRAPVDIDGSVPGTGDGSVGGVLAFDGRRHNQRPGLLLQNGVLYIAFAAHCDVPPHHGWVFAYDAKTLERRAIWVTTPDGESAGIWQSGVGLSADDAGRVYFTAGQGVYPPYVGRVQNGFGQTVGKLRLHKGTLELEDWFIPFDFQDQNDHDEDMSFGPVIIPNSNLAVALMMGRSRAAKMYVLQRDNFGHFHDEQADEITQTVPISDPDFTADPQRLFWHRANSTVYWKNRLYVWSQNDFPRAYAVQGNQVSPTPTMTGTTRVHSVPGSVPVTGSGPVTGMLSISADGDKGGILWGSQNVLQIPPHPASSLTSSNAIGLCVLYAFHANTLEELWNSRQNEARDRVGPWAKWPQPVVGGGKVFMATNQDANDPGSVNQIKVYGLFDDDE